MRQYKVIDCFCGAGGLSLGFERAGFEVAYAFDFAADTIKTYQNNPNHHHGPAFVRDIHDVCKASIEADLGRELGPVDVIIGGPPCQGFSVQRRGGNEDPRNELVLEYVRLVKELKPYIFVMENVGGILSERGKPFVKALFENLTAAGYSIQQKKLLASDYGVPQDRTRVIIVGELTNGCDTTFTYPEKITGPKKTVREAIADLMDKDETKVANHRSDKLSAINLKRIQAITEGQGRDSLPEELQLECHKNNSGHRHLDTYGRMAWDLPAPTITARFDSFSRGRFGHNQLQKPIGGLLLPAPLAEPYCGMRQKKLIDLIDKPQWVGYISDNSAYTKQAQDTLIPDLISIVNSDGKYYFIIFDAKYYNLQLENKKKLKGQPGIESITKQYLYQLAYNPFISAHQIHAVRNCFLLPIAGEQFINKGYVYLDMMRILKLQDIQIRLLPATVMYSHYLNNTKLDIRLLKL